MALFKKLIFRHLNQALHKPQLHFSVLLSLSFSLHSFVFFPHSSSFCDHEEAAVFHIQLHNCVCVCECVCINTSGNDTGKKKVRAERWWTNIFSSLWLTFICLYSLYLSSGVSLILSSHSVSRCPSVPSILSSTATYRVTGLWNVKNCSMHGNSLSCQTSPGLPQATGRHRETKMGVRKRHRQKKGFM